MARQPTIRDVAQKCGFSKSTVSLVLQDSPEIPDTTKTAVCKAMQALGYRHNRFARSLRTRRSHVVGMVIQDHLNPFYAEIVQHAEQLLRRHGYDLVVSSSNTDLETEVLAIERLFGMQVDGMIVSTMDYARAEPLLTSMQTQGTHCVVAGPAYPGIPFDAATINDRPAMRAVMEHLFALGHRHIGFIWGAPPFQAIGARFEVFRQELETAGLSVREEWVKRCGFRLQDGYAAARELLQTPAKNRPTAIFALNDLLALATIRAAHDLKLTVPGDVSVVGADNVQLATSFCPSLTTIDQPIEQYATELTNLAITGIEQKTTPSPAKLRAATRRTSRSRSLADESTSPPDSRLAAAAAAAAVRPPRWTPRRVELMAGFLVRESTGAAPSIK
ncbi:LacI family transcriptional regulator [Opitutaceae bacterium TAV4]|nr:LacI family transcriptional regulator [Opitutaceae bacterium TAV3]RRK01267.1 LacI family transcriptional regulator [Opitutaceae bacterium TAV4]